ncbi:MAG: L-aspartate oxidase [Planctomycetota bacterium]|nr:MAG: L-aspartate oxidase [Planctomycetota bacterium]REJ92646.1 MAG: L-aspartate oxidase [Planctomycetota bacterium]REK26784.1 MAG: L-aspartate oxidase [Planctomycetota bacterium]REK28328.1 MAG: L-aspartate oxidase [Planctomycetota bacterium]
MPKLTLTPRHRYLARFHPKRVPHMFADVLILGAGIAGVRAALEVDPSLRVVVVTKDRIDLSNSAWAQGGIAGVLDPSDRIEDHAADTISTGAGLCDEAIVSAVVEAAPQLIRELESYGAIFDQIDGHIALTMEGGHSHPRVAHALGDATGKEVMRALINTIRGVETVEIWEQTFTIDLLTCEGACRGALVWNADHGKTFVWAKQTILATGGAGRLYRETTNPDIATADGHAAAFRAGAELRDMEMMQFHPTVLYIAGSSRHLISEAVRGEGAHLVDSTGHRFMGDYDERLELAPRDVVSRAITSRMEETRHPCVYLDLRHIDREKVSHRFPNIGQVCREFGLDLAHDLIPVRPGAHYMIGGLTIDDKGRTTLPGLWAAGEATSSGLHGANRLASNSLLEGLYFGRFCGLHASEDAVSVGDEYQILPLESAWEEAGAEDDELNLSDLQNSLSSIMWRNVGIRRDAQGLQQAARQVDFWDRYVSSREFDSVEGWELQNMLLTARLMIASADQRTESRGVHYRSDFPEMDADQAAHVSIVSADAE